MGKIDVKGRMSPHIERLKLAIACGYPSSDLIKIVAQGNLEMWDSFVDVMRDYSENTERQREAIQKIKDSL